MFRMLGLALCCLLGACPVFVAVTEREFGVCTLRQTVLINVPHPRPSFISGSVLFRSIPFLSVPGCLASGSQALCLKNRRERLVHTVCACTAPQRFLGNLETSPKIYSITLTSVCLSGKKDAGHSVETITFQVNRVIQAVAVKAIAFLTLKPPHREHNSAGNLK